MIKAMPIIRSPEIDIEREEVNRVIDLWFDNTPGDHETAFWRMVQLRIDLLIIAVETAVIAQIREGLRNEQRTSY